MGAGVDKLDTDRQRGGLQRGVDANARTTRARVLRAPERVGEEERRASAQGATALVLADVYRDHADFVWRVARRLGAPEDALEDVVHDVFLVVHRRLSEYDGRAAMTTWLFHITRGVVSNTRRGRARAEQRLRLVEPPRPTLTPEERSDRAGAARFVRAFLDTLPADRRELFTLVDVEGLSVRAAAEHLGVNVNTAHARLRAARSAFREAVRERDRSAPARSARS